MLQKGDCFLIETNRDETGAIHYHLFVMLLDPRTDKKETIIVNLDKLTSPRQDQTTVLNTGDHEFIKRPTYVNYRMARIISEKDLLELVNSGIAIKRTPMENGVLQRIREGVLKSPFTPGGVCEFYEDYLYEQLS